MQFNSEKMYILVYHMKTELKSIGKTEKNFSPKSVLVFSHRLKGHVKST